MSSVVGVVFIFPSYINYKTRNKLEKAIALRKANGQRPRLTISSQVFVLALLLKVIFVIVLHMLDV